MNKDKPWVDSPTSIGLTPREIMGDLASDFELLRGDAELILRRTGNLLNKGIKGRSVLELILTSTILYIQWPGSGRNPIDTVKFAKICSKKNSNE